MSLGLRQELKLEQRLDLRLNPPTGMDFTEPEALEPIQWHRGDAFIEISEDELQSYAAGCQRVKDIIEQECPDIIMVALRGALPVYRSIKPFNGTQKRVKFVKTSYFLNNLSGNVSRSIGKWACNDEIRRILMLDTSVTGTKLSWFLPQVLTGLAADEAADDLEFLTAVLWHDKDGWTEETNSKYGSVANVNYNIGVKNLICEDSPTLLGIQYARARCHAKAQGKVRAYDQPVLANIHVVNDIGQTQVYSPEREMTPDTASLFSKLVSRLI